MAEHEPVADTANDELTGWLSFFPGLGIIEPWAKRQLIQDTKEVRLSPQTPAFREGDAATFFPFVCEGSVRVRKISSLGREITLYRVTQGEICTLSTACLLGGDRFPAEGIAETNVHVMALPAADFQNLVTSSPNFRQFVFTGHADMLSSLIGLVQEIAFEHIDARLADRLLQQVDSTHHLTITHQDLASQLGSVREVVSRRLKRFERQGWLSLARGEIHILDMQPLCELAEKIDKELQ